MPKPASCNLIWRPEQASYALYTEGRLVFAVLPQNQEAWHGWLSEHTSFSFQGQEGHLNLLKERRARGGEGYWYAYRREKDGTAKKYAGRSAELSLARLEELARAFRDGESNRESRKVTPGETEPSYQTPLLVTKLSTPRLPSSLVHRERLFKFLDEGLEGRLTLLAAPAGYGKTTLVRAWIESRAANLPPVSWLALDSGDNDPARFWTYFIAACKNLAPDLSDKVMELLHSSLAPPFRRLSLDTMLAALLNELARQPRGGLLVLEDYHEIGEPQIHRALDYFIEYLPSSFHLVMISRYTPPLSLARLRARGELVELNAAHLHFSPEETNQFLRQTLHFSPDSLVLDRLMARTEGWAAALRLIALTTQGNSSEIARTLESISGTQRHIMEYLVTEVLAAQPETIQEFLLKTTGLNRLTGSLCDAVTGRQDGGVLLEQVERANLFLVPLDGTGQWYRYHALFAEAMQQEARRRLGESALRSLASRASDWYAEHSFLSEAVEAAMAAGENERAARIINGLVEANPLNQFNGTLLRWLAHLTPDLFRRYPALSQSYAMLILFTGEAPPALLKAQLAPYLQIAEDSYRAAGRLDRVGEVIGLKAMVAGQFNEMEEAFHYARQSLALLAPAEKLWRSTCLTLISVESILAGRLKEANAQVEEARNFIETLGNNYAHRAILLTAAQAYTGQGRLQQAAELCRQALETATRDEDYQDKCTALAILSVLSYEWNRLEQAEQQANEALAQSQMAKETIPHFISTITLARVQQARGNTGAALALLEQYRDGPAFWQREIELWRLHFTLASGNTGMVEGWLYRQPEDLNAPESHRERVALLKARVLLERGRGREALSLLADWLPQALEQGRTRSEIEILLLTARAHFIEKRPAEAQQALIAALALARPAGYIRLFLDQGQWLPPMLKSALSQVEDKIQAAYLGNILAAATRGRNGEDQPSPTHPGPLSPQEIRVLRLLVAGHTNPEIARQLVVSPNTIKTQVKSIYRKLEVSDRLQAAEAARKLRLL